MRPSSAKLKEKFIQQVAIDTLAAYYYKYSYNQKIFAATEVFTKTNKRADGLIVWKHNKRKTNVASIEAKSANTLKNLIAKPHQKKILRHSQQLSFAILLGVTLLVFGLGYRLVLEPLLTITLLVFLVVLTWAIEKFLHKTQLKRHQKIDALEQLEQYPANERWLAIGFDSYSKEEQFNTLVEKCTAQGFGLLVVRDENDTTMELLPSFENYPMGSDFLHFYQKEASIRKEIASDATFGLSRRSPSQKAYELRQGTFIFFYLLLFLFCSYWYIRPVSSARSLPAVTEEQPPIVVVPPTPIISPALKKNIPVPPTKQIVPLPPTIICQPKIEGIKYIVKVDLLDTEAAAKEKVRKINALNPRLKSDYFWLPCYETPSDKQSFCVYVYPPRSDKDPAERNLARLKNIPTTPDISFEKAEIWTIASLTVDGGRPLR